MSAIQDPGDSFRDQLATIDTHGKRKWVYPLQPSGKLYRARTILAVFLLIFYLAAPFIRLGGQPLLMFDIINRKFFFFSIPFFPQDFHLVVLTIIAFAVFVILFTAAFGRLFCGWACPQTVFLEMVFRRIEFWIEGNGSKQRKLNAGPWNASKVFKKTLKLGLFFVLSFILGNVTLAYFVGSDRLISFVTEPPAHHPAGFIFVVIFTLVTFGVFARFREQVCTLVCPYGRLQSVLLDNNSIVVAYDQPRGEPRAKPSKNRSEESGDCVDCRMCVQVCPTGIDIRNGTQLECVNCAACIDACNIVMAKQGKPPKLIRYASSDLINHQKKFRYTGRLKAYTAALALFVVVLAVLGGGRSAVETTILRTTGSLYETLESGDIRNLYTVKVLNKTSNPGEYQLRLKFPESGMLKVVGPPLNAGPRENTESVFYVEIPARQLFSANSTIVIEVLAGDRVLEEVRSTFNGPHPTGGR